MVQNLGIKGFEMVLDYVASIQESKERGEKSIRISKLEKLVKNYQNIVTATLNSIIQKGIVYKQAEKLQ